MPFGRLTWVCSRKDHVLDGPRFPKGKGQFWGCPPQLKASGAFAAVYAKTAEPIEMPFEGRIKWAQGTIIIQGQSRMNPFFATGVTSLWFWHTGQLSKNGWTDRDAVWGADSCGSKNHGSQDRTNPLPPRGVTNRAFPKLLWILVIIRPHRSDSQRRRPIATHGVAWSVSLCVFLCVCWSHSWVLQKQLNRSTCRLGGWVRWAQQQCIGQVHADSKGKGQFLGVVCPTAKHWKPLQRKIICWSLSRCKICHCANFGWILCSSFDNMQVLIRLHDGWQEGDAAFRQNSLNTCYYHCCCCRY